MLRFVVGTASPARGVPHWNNESFQEGQARLAVLLAHLANDVAKLDLCMVPLNKQLNLANKVGLAQASEAGCSVVSGQAAGIVWLAQALAQLTY